jgi:hypothetical protein
MPCSRRLTSASAACAPSTNCQLRLIARFRPQRADGGSYPYHWLIDQLGAEVVAAARDERPPRRDHARLERRRWTSTRTLAHRLGVNQFFTDLAGHARAHPDTELQLWLPEAVCQRAGAFVTDDDPALLRAYEPSVRPDGYGLWAEDGHEVPFFLEYDTGTEQLNVLTGKLIGYARLFATLDRSWPVLFWLHSAARERNLRQRLADLPGLVPVATANRDDTASRRLSPAEEVWAVNGMGDRRRLIDLPRG